MKERPILFSGAMVRALLDGSKTQTRRAVRPLTADRIDHCPGFLDSVIPLGPYGVTGDRLWVRETWGYNPDFPGMPGFACYHADRGHEHDGIKWKPSIHMPRAACRLKLEVMGVRVERLQDISDGDAVSEGVNWSEQLSGWHVGDGKFFHGSSPKVSYAELWDSLNAARGYGWDANPWVWVIEFQRTPA